MRPRRSLRFTVGAIALSLAAACVGVGVDNYEEFRSALDRGASCSELIDQRDGLTGADRQKATADLQAKGCVARPQPTQSSR